jgi:hypothetical protein
MNRQILYRMAIYLQSQFLLKLYMIILKKNKVNENAKNNALYLPINDQVDFLIVKFMFLIV